MILYFFFIKHIYWQTTTVFFLYFSTSFPYNQTNNGVKNAKVAITTYWFRYRNPIFGSRLINPSWWMSALCLKCRSSILFDLIAHHDMEYNNPRLSNPECVCFIQNSPWGAEIYQRKLMSNSIYSYFQFGAHQHRFLAHEPRIQEVANW